MNHFNFKLYQELYPDLKENDIETEEQALLHWKTHGKSENRVSTINEFIKRYNFDFKFYKNYYNLIDIETPKDAVLDWIKIGKKMGRVYRKEELSEKDLKTFFEIVNAPIKTSFFKLNNNFNLDFLSKSKTKISICKIKHNPGFCKGINIDLDIIKNALTDLKFEDIDIINIKEDDLSWLANNNSSKNKFKIPLKSEYYIFSEIILFDLFKYLLKEDKKIIVIPNIDSYDSFSKEMNWFANLQVLNTFPNFHIWSKTRQIYDWMKTLDIKNNTFINFLFYTSTLKKTVPFNTKPYILLDTGSSLSERKYLLEIINIFYRFNTGFKLVIKTVPIVYVKKNLHRYSRSKNIVIVNELMSLEELDKFYSNFEFIIYLAKFDGFGLTLSKAMSHNMFIISGNGLPWSELLEKYPRKCLVKMDQDFSKSIDNKKKGFMRQQIYYKCDFSDLLSKIKETYLNRQNIRYKYETVFFNWLNKYIFLSNIFNFFNTESYYNKTSVHLCSFKDRSIILLENLVNILFQTQHINIYLNSVHEYTLYFLKKMNNVKIIKFYKDMKALSKLYCLCKSKSKSTFNFIIDDDILYPNDYLIYTCRLMNNIKNHNSVFSYNGFFKNYKLSFMKKHNSKFNDFEIDILGTGTVFYKGHNTINKEKILQKIKRNSDSSGIFADKFLSIFLEEEGVRKCYYNSKKFSWMSNNPKISLNPVAGLYEFKIKQNLIQEEFIKTTIEKEISCKKILYHMVDNSIMTEQEIYEKTKVKYLLLFLHCQVVMDLKNIDSKFPKYEYLILDTFRNCTSNEQPVKILNREENNESATMTIKEFLLSL